MSDHSSGDPTPRVVAVEDNPADARLLTEGAEAAGVDGGLEVITTGRKATEQLVGTDDLPPDLVFLDLNLPGVSGFDVLSAIRTESSAQELPVVVVSSSENSDDIGRVYELGANAYVMKPADPDDYIGMIEVAIDFWLSAAKPSQNND